MHSHFFVRGVVLTTGGQYLNAIWNVINFGEAEARYVEAAKQ